MLPDQENIQFNLYVKKLGGAAFSKLNSSLLSLTNFSPASGSVATGTQRYVAPVINGIEGSPSGIFTASGNGFTSYRSAYMDITFNPANDNLALTNYYTKFSWLVDLYEDGEYAYVVDRKSVGWSIASTDKVQGYLRNGTLLWTVDMGHNCQIDHGSADMVTGYDMYGDGKSEVIIKSSDGTKFANGKYVKGYTTPDIDGDGIVNYEAQSKRNPRKLRVNVVSTNSNKRMTLTGNNTINVPKSNGVVALNGLLTGTGTLVTTGLGQLNISGLAANTYTGGTVISGIRLSLETFLMNVSGFGTGTITLLNGATLRMYYNINTSSYQTSTWNLIIPDGNTATLIGSGRCTIKGTLKGGGTLNYQIPYVRADWSTDCSTFTGTINATSTYSSGSGPFRITANTNGLPLCTVNLANTTDLAAYASEGASSSTVVKIGALAGVAGSTVGSGTYTIGGNNKNAVFNGTINSVATITKIGTGNWTLSGANTCTTVFNVTGGKLIVTNTTGSATGTGNVTVGNTAVLAGTGIISGSLTMLSGSNLTVGNGAIGTLTVGSNLVLQTGSKTTFKISGSTNDKLNVGATMILKGTLEMVNLGGGRLPSRKKLHAFHSYNSHRKV